MLNSFVQLCIRQSTVVKNIGLRRKCRFKALFKAYSTRKPYIVVICRTKLLQVQINWDAIINTKIKK